MLVQPVVDPQSIQDADERGVALAVHLRQRDALEVALGPYVATEQPLIVVFERALAPWAVHLLRPLPDYDTSGIGMIRGLKCIPVTGNAPSPHAVTCYDKSTGSSGREEGL
jgi:hypothetical protein